MLFWLAGYLIARRRVGAGAPSAAGGPELERARGELKAALDRELRLVAELSIARGGQTAAQADQRRHSSEELSALRGELESLRRGGVGEKELAELKSELETARRAREVAALEARDTRAAVERALGAAQQRIGELEERLANAEAADTSVRADPRVLASVVLELERTHAEAAARETEAKRLRASLDQLQAEKKELLSRLAPNASPAR